MGVVEDFTVSLTSGYNSILNSLPPITGQFLNLFLIVLIIFIYSVFIWKFYRFIAHKNIIGLNLNKYNKSKHPFFAKLFAGIFYFVEYILILPFLIFFWFIFFTLFLIMLTEGIGVNAILIISATIISAIRMTSYYNEDLSKDLAKLLPLTLLAIAITKPGFFHLSSIIEHLSEIPKSAEQILIYLLFIISLEIILRFFDFIFSLIGIEDVPEIEED